VVVVHRVSGESRWILNELVKRVDDGMLIGRDTSKSQMQCSGGHKYSSLRDKSGLVGDRIVR
jgi:hypothetical protein